MNESDGDARSIEELLPWYVNGTLTADEEREVRGYLRGNETAEREVAWLKQIRQAVQTQEPRSPGSFGLQRLRMSLGREPAAKARPDGRGRWVRIAAAAAITVIVVQGILLGTWRYQSAVYEPAGTSGPGPLIQVRFEPGATERQVRTLLVDAGLEIVAGPSASGVYRLAPLATEDNLGRLVERLRRRDQIISFAEED